MRISAAGATATVCTMLGASLTLSCASDPSAPPTLRPLTLALEIVDSLGQPAPGSAVTIVTWPSPALPGTQPDRDERTDSAGRIRFSLGQYHEAGVDSLLVIVQARGCSPPSQYPFAFPGSQLLPAANDTLPLRVTVAPVPPPATNSPGAYCAFGLHPQWGPYREFGFTIIIDSTQGAVVRGHWSIGHIATIGTETGTFTGQIGSGVVYLVLVNDYPMSTCSGNLVGYAAADGSWTTAFFSNAQGCEGAPSRLDFTTTPG